MFIIYSLSVPTFKKSTTSSKHTPEHIKKISESLRRHYREHPEDKQKLIDNLKGHTTKGTKRSRKTKDRISIKVKEYYSEHEGYWKGKSPSQGHRRRLSDSLKKYYKRDRK